MGAGTELTFNFGVDPSRLHFHKTLFVGATYPMFSQKVLLFIHRSTLALAMMSNDVHGSSHVIARKCWNLEAVCMFKKV